MIPESEIIKRIRISNIGSSNKSYADEVIKKYKIAAKSRLKFPDMTQKWTIDNQRQRFDVNDKSKILGGRGSAYFDEIEFMIQAESKVEGMLGSIYPTSSRNLRSRKTFWERVNTSISGNPNFSNYNRQIQEEQKEKILSEKLKEEKRISQELLLIQNQSITFNEQVNSGDYNETPITDVNLNGGCSECSEPEHKMPDGSMMKDSEMEKEPLKVTAGMAGIAGIGIIGLLLYSRTVKK
jgi:hypothetical protein